MLKFFAFIRKYSFLLVVAWMAFYAFDLIDDLQYNYMHRSPGVVAWMIVSDFVRCLLVIFIWVACNYNPDGPKDQ